MKKETIFPARYELIKLYRKAVHDVETYETPENSQIMLAMDYFDALEVCRFDSDTDKFNEFMGLSIYEDLTEHDVAMQSIPLYCPELSGNTIEEYRCMNKCFKDPFDSEANEFRYFGMINIYITPEILVRFDRERFEASSVKDDNSIYLRIYNAFFKDLHILMSEFVRHKFPSNGQDEFRYRIYQSMSVGDFVVAMRCKEPEVPFEVASMLRRRRYDFKEPVTSNSNKEYTNFVFYKTYTLMSVNTQIIRADTVFNGSEKNDAEKNERSTRKFVLRCVLSNNYWSNEKAINEKFSSESIFNVSSCLRLNGRYDFTVSLSENAFLYIHPKLVQYKIGQQGKTDDSVVQQNSNKVNSNDAKRAIIPEDEEELRACEIIEFLIENKYISYVNERFLFRDNNDGIDASDYNREITIKKTENEFRFANEINAENLIKLKDSIRKEYQRVLRIDTSRRSVVYSMRLLERFVSICNSINGISDSRIYCSIIINQMQLVLEGVKWYLTYLGIPNDEDDSYEGPECNNAEYYELISALDTDLKEALEYMNSFAKYILDSSLQSLQTPHFNLETHVSVEKLLLSYSYFVQSFFDWYGQTEMYEKIGGSRYEYYTLMVPQSIDRSLSTKTLFNWKKYDHLQKRLLVVLCPSFNDLTNFPASAGSLLHEIAHSLRYEDRKTRNKTILQYGHTLLFDQVCENIAEDFRNNIPGVPKDYEYYIASIRSLLTLAYEEHIVQKEDDEYLRMNFTTLIDEIKEEYRDFVDAIRYLTRLRRLLIMLLKDIDFRLNSEYREILIYADKFFQLYFGDKQEEKHELEEYIDAYNHLVFSIEQFELDQKRIKSDDSNETKKQIIRLKDFLYGFNYTDDDNLIRGQLALCKRVIEFENKVNSNFRRILMEQRDRVNSRSIARYLKQGTYADLEGKEDSFAIYAESYIILSEAATIAFYDLMIHIYKEVASDLYMVKLLGLTPYGYLNFYTWNIPVDDVMEEDFLRRFCIVLFVMTVLGKNGRSEHGYEWESVEDEMYNEFRKMYRSVFKHFSEFTRKYSDVKYDKVLYGVLEIQNSGDVLYITDYLKQLNGKANACIDDFETELLIENLRLVTEATCAIKDSLRYSNERSVAVEQERFVTELMHCRYLCSNLLALIYECNQHIQSVTGFQYLADDFSRGCRNLDLLHEEFKKSYIWKYCVHFVEAYNEEHSHPLERADANKLIAKFVLDMNYSMLYKNAFKMIE